MISRCLICVVFLAVLFFAGCISTEKSFKSEYDEYRDSMWRQGYGFNNPNPERVRNGQPAVNFDGKVPEKEKSWHWMDLFL